MRRPLALLGAVLAPLGFAAAITAATPQAATGATATYKLTYVTLPTGAKVPVRWNGCQVAVTWKVNLGAVPSALRPAVLSETKTVVSRMSTYMGIKFSYKGFTTEVPRTGSMPKQSAELVIAYTSPSKTNYALTGSVLGVGGYQAYWTSRTVSGRTTYAAAAQRGFVVIDTPQMVTQAKGGFGTGARRSNLLLHELGHAFGLSHVSTTSQQMYPMLSSASPNGMAGGDRLGLSKVGKAAGCINTSSMPLRDLS